MEFTFDSKYFKIQDSTFDPQNQQEQLVYAEI